MDKCKHTITQGRHGEKGAWCVQCGEKTYAVDARECGDCAHHSRLLSGSICKKHLMAIVPTMHVTFSVADGTCWEAGGTAEIVGAMQPSSQWLTLNSLREKQAANPHG